MNELFIYFIKINAGLALFYLLFRVFFARDTFWVGRRVYLISAIALSLLYPLVSLASWLERKEPVQIFIAEWMYAQEVAIVVEASSASAAADVATVAIPWQQIFIVLYVLVSVFLLARFFVQLASVLLWHKRSRKAIINNIPVRVVSENIAPFSFFKSIYVNPQSLSDEELSEILTHENTHARQWHSADVILSELLTIVFWANPFAWLLKREIRQNLEFLADNQVLEFGFDTRKYQYFLTNLALYSPEIRIINNLLNVSTLKKRIVMMNKSKTKKAGLIKYSLILPVALMLVLTSSLFSACKGGNRTNETEDKVFEVVDVPAQFAGGMDAMNRFLADNIRYPVIALENNIQGRVVVQFIVSSTGEITDVEVVRGVDPLLDREAVRVVERMPAWIPGEHEGQKVRTKFTFPVTFRIDGTPQTCTAPADPNEVHVVGLGAAPATATQQAPPPPPAESIIFEVVEVQPQFPGGNAALQKFLAENIRFPIEAKERGIQGRVVVQFVVNTDGSIQDVQVVRGVDPLLDREAVRVVQAMPRWTPGQQRGQNVRVRFALPITFRLD